MKFWITLCTSCLALAGCGEVAVDTRPLADAQHKIEQAKEEAGAMTEKVKQFHADVGRWKSEGDRLAAQLSSAQATAQDGWAFVHSSIASVDEKVQATAAPVLAALAKQSPESAAQVKATVEEKLKTATGAAKTMWENLLKSLESANAK